MAGAQVPSAWQSAEIDPAKPVLQVPEHDVPGAELGPHEKAPFCTPGLPLHTAAIRKWAQAQGKIKRLAFGWHRYDGDAWQSHRCRACVHPGAPHIVKAPGRAGMYVEPEFREASTES